MNIRQELPPMQKLSQLSLDLQRHVLRQLTFAAELSR